MSSQPYPIPELKILTQAYPYPELTPQLPQINTQYFPKCPFYASNFNTYSDEYNDYLIQYTFSTPREIFTPDYSLESLQWLPDGTHLLLTYSTPEKVGTEFISIFDISTEFNYVISERLFNYVLPIWLEERSIVVYSDVGRDGTYDVKAVNIDGFAPININNTTQPYLLQGPDGSIISFSPLSPSKIDFVSEDGILISTFDFENFTTHTEWVFGPLLTQPNRLAWNPLLGILAINAPRGLFFVDIDAGNACQVDLGTQNQEILWPYFTRWSPDNRYLAILSTTGTGILPFIKILVLDTQTGQILGINPAYLEFSNTFFTDISWSPDSQTIASLVGQGNNRGNYLVLIDIATGYIKQISPENTFFQSGVAGNIDWSPSGANIAAVCSDGSICIIDIFH